MSPQSKTPRESALAAVAEARYLVELIDESIRDDDFSELAGAAMNLVTQAEVIESEVPHLSASAGQVRER